jgi:hypothetical protein
MTSLHAFSLARHRPYVPRPARSVDTWSIVCCVPLTEGDTERPHRYTDPRPKLGAVRPAAGPSRWSHWCLVIQGRFMPVKSWRWSSSLRGRAIFSGNSPKISAYSRECCQTCTIIYPEFEWGLYRVKFPRRGERPASHHDTTPLTSRNPEAPVRAVLRSVIEARDIGMRRSLGGLRMWHGAARCRQTSDYCSVPRGSCLCWTGAHPRTRPAVVDLVCIRRQAP